MMIAIQVVDLKLFMRMGDGLLPHPQWRPKMALVKILENSSSWQLTVPIAFALEFVE